MDTAFTVLISSITGLVTFFVGHRRAKKEVEGMALDNISKSLDIYNRIVENLKGEIEQLTNKVQELETKIDSLKEENSLLKDQLKDMLKNKK